MALTWELPYSNCSDIFALARWRLFQRRTWTPWRPFGKRIAMESLDSSSSARFGDKCAVSSTSLQRRFPGSQRLGTSDSWYLLMMYMCFHDTPHQAPAEVSTSLFLPQAWGHLEESELARWVHLQCGSSSRTFAVDQLHPRCAGVLAIWFGGWRWIEVGPRCIGAGIVRRGS